MPEPNEPFERAHLNRVDRHPDTHLATEPDEEQVLRDLYGEPDEYGFYRGEEASDG